jgi:transposase
MISGIKLLGGDPMARGTQYLTDDQWEKLEPFLPQLMPGPQGGRPWADNRMALEGILWILRTGARWKDLPERYPSASTCWRRLKLWEEKGVWLDVWRKYLADLDEETLLHWEEAFIDGSFAPAKKGGRVLAKRRKVKVQSGWWWSTAKVFLWEASLPRHPRRK